MNTQIDDYNLKNEEENQYFFEELYIVPLVDQNYIHIYNDDLEIKLLTLDENNSIKATLIESIELQLCLMNHRIEWNSIIKRMHQLLLHQDFSKPAPKVLEQNSLINYMRFFHYLLLDKEVARKMFGYTCFHSRGKDLLGFINGVAEQNKRGSKTFILQNNVVSR